MKRLENRAPEYPQTGTRFGNWTYLRPGEGYRWCMQCVCGTVREIRSQDLRQGASTSCGCLSSFGVAGGRANLKHGVDYGSKLYRTWRNAKNRCFNPKATKYKDYGAVGISMCSEWANSFEAFAEALGEPPSNLHSIDRIDNTLGYVPGNIRWATAKEQANNRKNSRLLTFQGATLSLSQWAEKLGIGYRTLNYRLLKGWSVEKILSTTIKGKT